jgi:predicted DNA-binding transcriptional regulator AlpA
MATFNKGKNISPRLWTVEQTAQYLGLKPRTIYNGIGRKAKKRFPIKPKRIGKAVRFDIEDIDRYLDSL